MIWCLAEIRHGKLASTAFELLTAGRKLADARKVPLAAVVLGGPEAASAAEELAQRGADKVLVLQHQRLAQFDDQAFCRALQDLAKKEAPSAVLLPASVWGRSLAPRLAVALKGGLASDAIDLGLDPEGRLLVTRSCYAGNVLSTVSIRAPLAIATLRPMAFARSGPSARKAEVVSIPVDATSWGGRTEFLSFKPEESNEIDLSSAEKVVSGGRGLGNPEGFSLIYKLAHALGAAVGASRAAVDAGWIAYRHQVGLTGRSVRPRLYMACGISGQIQHLAGMSSSDVIVAVNTDPDCPMMKMATYAVAGDLYKILPALIEEIAKARGEVPAAR